MPTDTKTALLESAERAVRSRGFDAFSYADLSEDVGIRKASIHYHFPTKAALSVALMERYRAKVQVACADIAAMHETGGARLKALIGFYRAAMNEGRSLCLCIAYSTSRNSLPEDVVAQVSRFRQMMIDWIGAAFVLGKTDGSITQVGDPEVEASAALPLLEGAHLTARIEENPALFDRAVRALMQRL